MRRDPRLRDLYAEHLEETMGDARLDGIKIVLDGANGAAYQIAPRVVRDLGAEVVPMHCAPDGVNINEGCGSLHPQEMMARVTAEGADVGLAFDGDADRVMLSDEQGRLVDGDRVMLLVGRHLASQGKLAGSTVVGTIMSNMGLEVALREAGLSLLRANVGDRYVSEAMRQGGYVLGGEKSGHLIFGHLTTTGDGLLTALQVLKVMRETGKPLSVLADQMTEYPQVLLGVRVRDRQAWQQDADISRAIAQGEAVLAGRGRLNVRASGTEKLVRVMAEGPDAQEIETLASGIAALVQRKLGV
jgi:phosphoglucosamine mutase